MSEFKRSPEIEPTVELIASGLRRWLVKEVGSSATGRNHYLDNFDEFHQSLDLSYSDQHNTLTHKNRSHYNRLIVWSNFFADYDELDNRQKERAVAQQIFGAQMLVSGIFRFQCFAQAVDQDDYYKRRLEGDCIGINIEEAVSNRLDQLFDGIPEPTSVNQPLTLQELIQRTLAMNQRQQECITRLYEADVQPGLHDDSPIVASMTDTQTGWVNLIVDYVAFAASERGGDLATVPFLEPKSISDNPQIYYPFAAEAA